ncbi:MAG: PAS domain S-box protein [Calditrichaeota bacterium]|nr:PAS domain S-box protein [Calditrichota bacterium]
MKQIDQARFIRDLSLLYELSLAIGQSKDLVENCDRFLQSLLSRKNFTLGSIWINHRYLKNAPEAEGYALVYIIPVSRKTVSELPVDHPIAQRLAKEAVIFLPPDTEDFQQMVTEKYRPGEGMIIFRLGEIGFLKLYFPSKLIPYYQETIRQLQNVITKFTHSLEGNLAEARLMEEIRERQRVESELRHLSTFLSTLMNTLTEGILVEDKSRRIIYINHAFRHIFELQRDAEAIIGHPLKELRDQLRQQFKNQRIFSRTKSHNGKPVPVGVEIHLNNGKILEQYLIPIYEKNETIYYMWKFRDITIFKQIEKELKNYQKHLEKLVSRRTRELEASNRKLKAEIQERKQIEKHLRESEQKFRRLIELSPNGIMIIDLQGYIQMCSPAMLRILDADSEAQLLGRNFLEFLAPESRPLCRECFQKVLESPVDIKRVDSIMITLKQRRVHVETDAAFFEWQGKPAVQVVVRDVSERIQTAEEMKRLYSAIQQTDDHIFITDRNGVIEYVNPSVEKCTGYRREELIGKTPAIFNSGRHPEEFFKKMWDEILAGHTYSAVFVNRKKNGELYFEEKTITPIRNSRGEITHFVSTGRDITERIRAEEKLKESEERFRRFFEQDLTGDFIATPDGKIQFCNPAFARILGFATVDEAAAINLKEFYPSPEQWEELIQRVKKQKKLEQIEVQLKRRDGRPIHIIENVIGIFDRKGELKEVQGYLFDVTEHKKLEEQLRQSQKMEAIGQLAGGIAHDFNNLLTVINGYCELLLLQLKPEDPTYSKIQMIQNAGEKAASLTSQLLAFSRRQVMKPEVVNLNQLITGLTRMLRRLIRENIRIETRLAEDLGNTKIDPVQMEQVLVNLVVNARDAMPEGGKIMIETQNVWLDDSYTKAHFDIKAGPYVMLAVSDTGIGMSKDIMDHIFEPFFTTKEKGKGTGLGLSTVYGIIKQSNGYIMVYSEPGKGTTFKIYLPRIMETAPRPQRQKSIISTLTGNETILIVEDEEMVRQLAMTILKDHGYRVLAARNGEEALKLGQNYEGKIDLLLTDVVMPSVNGPELGRLLKKYHPGLKVIFMSGYTDNSIQYHLQFTEGALFIQKPFSSQKLLQTIRKLLETNPKNRVNK